MIWLWIYLAEGALIAFLAWVARGPRAADEWCECRDCCDAVAVLEVWLEQPAREACALNDDEQDALQQITRGESQ